jgi:hypothetical protein
MDTGVRYLTELPRVNGTKNALAGPPYYQWRSSSGAIFLRAKEHKGDSTGPLVYTVGIGFYLLQLDTRTGRETSFTEFNQRFFGRAYRMIGYWRLSPDGNWLFWPEDKSPHATWFVASLDGARRMSWSQPTGDAVGEDPFFAWTPDSRRWVALVRREDRRHRFRLDAVIGSLNTPGSLREIKNIHTLPDDIKSGIFSQHALLGITSRNEAVAAIWDGGQDTHAVLFSFAIDAQHPSARDFGIRFPQGANARTLALSPKGDRLAWVFLFDDDRSEEELWVSGLDGTRMHKVGVVSYKPLFPMADERHLEGLAWTQDGREISFIHTNALCTVRAE